MAVPPLQKYDFAAPREFLLLASYCGDDTPGCSDARPCTECLAMCNIYDEDGKYLRQLGSPVTPQAVAPAEEIADRPVGFAYQDTRWIDNGRWHLCMTEPRAIEGRTIQRVYLADALTSLSAIAEERRSMSLEWKNACERSEAEASDLRRKLEERRKALEPFAAAKDHFDGHVRDDDTVDIALRHIRARHVRAAARALTTDGGPNG